MGTTAAQAMDKLNLNLRLKLNGITKVGTDGSAEPYYTFNYNTLKLPPRLSVSQDWYGYFNNRGYAPPENDNSGILLSIPLHTVADGLGGTYSFGVNKAADANYLQADILTSVTNGLGGESVIRYEAPPNLSDVTTNPSDLLATGTFDGVCVSEVDYSDGFEADNSYTTTYTYTNGYRFFQGGYFSYPLLHGLDPFQKQVTNHMVDPIDFFNGSNHGFSNVLVNKKNYEGDTVSEVAYVFSNIVDPVSGLSTLIDTLPNGSNGDGFMNVFPRTSMNQPAMGLINEVTEYGVPTNTPLKRTLYTYTFDNYTPIQNTAVFQCSYQPPGTDFTNNSFYLITYMGGFSGTSLALNGGYIDRTPIYFTGSSGTYAGPYPDLYLRNYNVFNSAAVNVASKTDDYILRGYQTVNMITNETDYTYDPNDQLSTESWTDSKGGSFTRQYFHNYDYTTYTDASNSAQTAAMISLQAMNNAGLQTIIAQETRKNASTYNPLEVTQFFQSQPNYTVNGGGVSITTINSIANSTLQQPVPTTTFHAGNGTAFTTNSFYNYDVNVNDITHITKYDDHNNVIEANADNGLKITSAIWDTHIEQPVAKVVNAQYSDIAYTSFEESVSALGVTDYNKGNWDYNPASIVLGSSPAPTPITGRYYYQLVNTANYNTIKSVNPLKIATTYLLSFWCDSPPTVTLGANTINLQLQAQAGNWKLYTAYVQGNNALLTLTATASGNEIDELRLLPPSASMDTYTYEPLMGLSSHCDERNNIIYYKYDAFGNLKTTADINGNILSLTNTVIQGNDN